MEARLGFELRQVHLVRSSKSYGFVIRRWTEKAPTVGSDNNGLNDVQLYYIGDIVAGGSAENSEMQPGDRIVSLNRHAVTGLDNPNVLDIVRRSNTLDLLLIPSGEHGLGRPHPSYRMQQLGHHARKTQPRANKMERIPGYASQQRLHCIREHGELALYRQPQYKSMVFVSSHSPTDAFSRIMETNGVSAEASRPSRNNSINSLNSTESHSTKPVLRRANSENIQQKELKLSLLQTDCDSEDDISIGEVNGAIHEQVTSARQTLSTGCLIDPALGYSTFARITDRSPQNIFTPSPSGGSQQSEQRRISRLKLTADVRAPVATEEEPNTPDLDTIDCAHSNSNLSAESELGELGTTATLSETVRSRPSSEERGVEGTQLSGYENGVNKVRFLPAYRAKTVEEMMQDRSVRAAFRPSTKTVQRSQSTRNSPNMGSPAYNYSSSTMRPSPGRIYRTPSPQIRPYNGVARHRPSTTSLRINDGTHPRMPMRAVHPHTYNGFPVQPNSSSRYGQQSVYDGKYNTMRPNMSYGPGTAPHTMNHSWKANSQGDVTRNRMYSDNSSPPLSQVDGRNIRSTNSELDIEQPRPDRLHRQSHAVPPNSLSIPSGTYVASSSMTSLPQYAQLMPPSPVTTPQRADSAGNVRRPSGFPAGSELGTRHSYSVGNYQHKLSIPSARVNSYDDVFDSSAPYNHGSTTPTSPVSRQPSYLTAMSDPIKQKHRVANGASPYSADGVVLRNKSAVQLEDSHQKIGRRTSYLMATSKPAVAVEEGQKTPNQKYRKLKKFFGEGTPLIKEGQEKALQSSSQPEAFALPDNLEVQKTGILAVKIVAMEGKKSHSRSWRGMGAVLSRDMLYLVKDKKENATMLTTPSGSLSIDEKPICITACYVDIAHAYTKKKNVFKLITSTTSEYLLQAADHQDMVEWIKNIEANRQHDKEKSSATKSEQLTSAELVKRINDQQVKLNQQKKRSLGGLSFKSKQPYASPSKNTDSSHKKEDKKKRSSSGPMKQLQFDYNGAPEPISGDFGMPLNESSPSHENEFVPLVVELCTKAIEDQGLDFVGIYRVPGNKAAVEQLKKELTQGIINLENDKWRDMNVLSSLLKTYFRRLPDSLVTSEKYKQFIESNRLKDAHSRLVALKQLIRTLPDYNYETLKYLAIHLRKVAEHCDVNKMDTRNLAIVFGPTIVRSGEDVMSLVTDMSDQYRIIESIIVYCDWVFCPTDSDPPALNEAALNCAPISETMNNLTAADIANLTSNKTKSKAELMSALSTAVSKKNTSKGLTANSISLPLSATISPVGTKQTHEDDHGFKNRDLQQEAAARNQRLLNIKEKEIREWHASQPSVQTEDTGDSLIGSHHSQCADSHHNESTALTRWHSEESVLVEHHQKVTHDQYPHHAAYYHMNHMSSDQDGPPPPPIPARGMQTRPPLPPKPMQLYRAKPTHIDSPESHDDDSSGKFYENYEHIELNVSEPVSHHRTLRVIQNPLKASSLPRRGSLDSMMDTLEPLHHYSSSSSTESQDGSDLLSSITATFDQKLKLLVDKKYRLDGQGNRRSRTSGDNSNHGSGVQVQCAPRASTSTAPSGRGSSDQSRESLLSILSNKENMNTCESFSSTQDIQSSDRGFDGSTSSVGSVPFRPDAKVGIASRIERKDMKPLGYPPAASATQRRVVNATGSVISHRNDGNGGQSSDEERDLANNNSLSYSDTPLVQRHMSDEKKRVRRRHTLGGARDDFDCEMFKDMIPEYNAKQNILNEAKPSAMEPRTAWQRLQPGGSKEPLSLQDWLERKRIRASSPQLEMHNTPNIMYLQTQ